LKPHTAQPSLQDPRQYKDRGKKTQRLKSHRVILS